ncbi:MAG: Fic family protein, partial [Bacteroidota bacterium]
MSFILPERLILRLHEKIINQSGGSHGLRDTKALHSSLSQPLLTFGGADLYSSFIEKGAALGFFLIANHPFVDGNKRIGVEAMK